MNLKPYPEYKDSGVAWLGDVPKHWEIHRNGNVFYEVVDINHPDEELLSMMITKGIVKQSSTGRKIRASEDRSAYKRIKIGDIGYNLMNAFFGGIGASKYEGILSPAYAVCRPRFTLEPWYFHYLFRTPIFMSVFNSFSYGIMYERNRLYFERFKVITSPLPPKEEQERIVNFLKYKTSQIARFIKAKKRMIELLKEQKQVIINDAVTGKIVIKDEGGRLKAEKRPDSSFIPHPSSFLQTVPDGWEVRRLRFLASITTGNKDTVDNVKDGVYPFFVRSQTIERINTYTYDGEAVLTAGDGVGVAKVFHYIDGKFDYHQRTYKFADFKYISGKFFFYYMKSNLHKEVLMLSAKSTVDSLRFPMLQNFIFAIPPTEEQSQIVSYIETKTAALDHAIFRTEREIALMQEYRTRLVSDVVTGKIDVRDIEIPDIADIDNTIDESIDEPEGEEELETAEAEE